MRILIISKHFPDNLSTKVHGVYKRFQMFIDAIKDIAEIDLLFYVPNGTDISSSSVRMLESSFSSYYKTSIRLYLCQRSDLTSLISKLQSYVKGFFSFSRQPSNINMVGESQVKSLEHCLSNNPDAIFIHRLGSICPFFHTQMTSPPIFLDLDDIEHITFRRKIPFFPKISTRLLSYLLLPSLRRGERKAIKLSHRTFICSDKDQEYLSNHLKLKGVCKISNAVHIPESQLITSNKTLLFLGSYNYKPNIDAVEYLIHQIWPFIYRSLPEATLLIAGHPPDNIPTFNVNTKGVKYTGFVDNLDDLYRQTRVVCAPILSGGGTRVKIIEAASYGKPIVSTRIGAEGIEMHDGHNIFLRDDPKSFADVCIRLLNDLALSKIIGGAARSTVIEKYDFNKIKQKIKDIIIEGI